MVGETIRRIHLLFAVKAKSLLMKQLVDQKREAMLPRGSL